MRAQNLLVLLGSITLMGCAAVGERVDWAGEKAAMLINGYCDKNPHAKAIVSQNVAPYLHEGNGVHCRGDAYIARR
jgi:hypothetical protein